MASGSSIAFVAVALVASAAAVHPAQCSDYTPSPSNMEARNWFQDAKFGIFLHWGLYSQLGGVGSENIAEWVMNDLKIPAHKYERLAQFFNPVAFDADQWVRDFKVAGARYITITSKHHDGFAMFASKVIPYNIADATPFKRDPLKELAEACKRHGLKLFFYYSQLDWHHPDYPAFTEADKPYLPARWLKPTPEQWGRYTDFMFGQVRELLTNYGPIDLIWFDGGWERTAEQWRAKELAEMIRSLQPGIVINDRLPTCGDYDTPEQFVPPQPPGRPWEVCMTMNESWGYNPADTRYKSPRQLVHTLCEIAGKGGRLLLNVSPMGNGRLPPEQLGRLEDVRSWMSRNGEAITGTRPGLEPWQFYGPSTVKVLRQAQDEREIVYLHLLMRPYETVSVRGVRTKRVKSVRILGYDRPAEFTTRCAILDSLLNADPLGELIITVPEAALDPYATVIAVEFSGAPV